MRPNYCGPIAIALIVAGLALCMWHGAVAQAMANTGF